MKRILMVLALILVTVVTATSQVGPRDVTVTTPSGTFTKPNAFSVTAALPSFTSIAPALGTQGATVNATLTGSNLASVTAIAFSGTGVTGALGTPTFTSIPVVITISGAATAGARNVTLTGPGGVSTLNNAFTVQFPGPTITTITPISAVQGTTVDVVVAGTNLLNATFNFGLGIQATVKPGGTATSVTVTLTLDGPIAYAPCLDNPIVMPRSGGGFTAGCNGVFGYLADGSGTTSAAAIASAKLNTGLRLLPPGVWGK